MKKLFAFTFLLLLSFQHILWASYGASFKTESERTGKILVLIIASDNAPYYNAHQNIWRSYMHLDPNIEAYFMKCDPQIKCDVQIEGDVIWVKARETYIPGILDKTIISMEYMIPRLKEFDYVLRTNLSSFYIFSRLINFTKNLPLNNCYCGPLLRYKGGIRYAAGSGFLLSTDLVELLVEGKKKLINHPLIDDVAIGEYLTSRDIDIIPSPRLDILNINSWNKNKNSISEDTFHFRLKNLEHKRNSDEIFIMSELLGRFYGIHLN